MRSLTSRITKQGEMMIIVGFADDKPEEREKLLSWLATAFPSLASLCWTIHLSGEHCQAQGEIIPYSGYPPYFFEHLAGFTFRHHANSFFQPNAFQARQIFLLACEWAALTGSKLVNDLYTGVGTITLFFLPRHGRSSV